MKEEIDYYYTVHHGNNMDVLKGMLNEGIQVDAVVTDPPYGLKFMGKKWDYDVPSVEFWKLIYQVLKPGGHILSCGGSRTYHRMVVNLENAGFEIRDCIIYCFGSGFPKSLNVSKAIQKRVDGYPIGLPYPDSPNHGKYKSGSSGAGPGSFMKVLGEITNQEITHEDALKWQGWGTALKPAIELIALARKSLSENTIIENVLLHGTGAINIDGCRIEGTSWKEHDATGLAENKFFTNGPCKLIHKTPHEDGRFPANLLLDKEAGEMLDEQTGNLSTCGGPKKTTHPGNTFKNIGTPGTVYEDSGGPSRFFKQIDSVSRFPANLILDKEAGEMLDEQTGILTSGKSTGKRNSPKTKNAYGDFSLQDETPLLGSSGGASRFYYCAKASQKERKGSKHPTVKPLSLMRYLCRLITPPKGIILDPFAGSGTTGEAAILEGVYPILIEMEDEYVKDIHNRLAEYSKKSATLDDLFKI